MSADLTTLASAGVCLWVLGAHPPFAPASEKTYLPSHGLASSVLSVVSWPHCCAPSTLPTHVLAFPLEQVEAV